MNAFPYETSALEDDDPFYNAHLLTGICNRFVGEYQQDWTNGFCCSLKFREKHHQVFVKDIIENFHVVRISYQEMLMLGGEAFEQSAVYGRIFVIHFASQFVIVENKNDLIALRLLK